MTDFYRFPALKTVQTYTQRGIIEKIGEELLEASAALGAWDTCEPYEQRWIFTRRDYGMELMDIIHACETALRMEFTDEEIDALHESVIEKNTARFYYQEQ